MCHLCIAQGLEAGNAAFEAHMKNLPDGAWVHYIATQIVLCVPRELNMEFCEAVARVCENLFVADDEEQVRALIASRGAPKQ